MFSVTSDTKLYRQVVTTCVSNLSELFLNESRRIPDTGGILYSYLITCFGDGSDRNIKLHTRRLIQTYSVENYSSLYIGSLLCLLPYYPDGCPFIDLV